MELPIPITAASDAHVDNAATAAATHGGYHDPHHLVPAYGVHPSVWGDIDSRLLHP